MQIIEIEIENNRAIKVFHSKLNGGNLEIAGGTGEGKTTAISSLWDIIEKRGDALRHGEKKGKIRVKLAAGDKKVIATRTMTEANSSITLMDENGDKISAQDFKRMISDLSVNPHRITSMKKAEQLECLIRSANLGDYDLKSADRQIAIETERRLELGRSMRATDPGEEPEKADKVDVTELMQQRDAVNEWNSLDERMDTKIEDLQTHLEKKIEAKKAYNEKIERQINELRQDLEGFNRLEQGDIDALEKRINEGREKIKNHKKNKPKIEVSSLDDRIANANKDNESAILHENWSKKQTEYEQLVTEHAVVDELVKKLVEERKEKLDTAKWPIEGLNIEEGNILYKDCLLENLGESEQMLVTAALAIEDIMAHDFHVVRMDGIESMSEDDFNALKKLFNDKGVQVLSTRVARGDVGDTEITITEGVYNDAATSLEKHRDKI